MKLTVRDLPLENGPSTGDFIGDLMLIRWAREHHVPLEKRDRTWPPIVLAEMERKDSELAVRKGIEQALNATEEKQA